MASILVLGAGMVGRAIALDLATEHDVTAADRDEAALRSLHDEHGLQTLALDVTDADALRRAAGEADLVVGAVPGFLGFAALRTVLEAGRNVVDISFFPEDALTLDALARAQGVTALVDFGVAPGMSNLILGYHDAHMTVASFECLVGGLPIRRTWPFAYKAPFSPIDVIEEYTRPARYVENGHVVVRPALSDVEHVTFEEVGTLEAFNTDGLRSLLATMPHVPDMKEKTLRYPGHARFIQALQAAGFFRTDPVAVNGASVTPLDVTARLLFDAWTLEPGEPEFTVMRVTVAGTADDAPATHTYHLYDTRDPVSGLSSMARTTGFTCAAGARLVLNGAFDAHGVFPPEHVGRHAGCFAFVLRHLAERGVVYRHTRTA